MAIMTTENWLKERGFRPARVFRNLTPAALVEESIRRGEGVLGANGTLMVRTGERTGRSPNDRFVIEDATTKNVVDWGNVNVACKPELFDHVSKKIRTFADGKDLFVFDGYVGADEKHRVRVRVVNTFAWHSLFVTTLFLRPKASELDNFTPDYIVYGMGGLKLDPKADNVKSNTAILMNFSAREIIVTGSEYGGEMKKSLFGVMNYVLPEKKVFPMHCSANVGKKGDTALFFGLSGTGKTTLSADPERFLIGDDEHGWSPDGIFNFEGGCYAKVIKLKQEAEPLIWNAIRFGSILENVVYDEKTRVVNYDADSITENTRATYPVDFIDNVVMSGKGGHPKNIFFLACDAFGVLPPISRLSPEAAMYHFISGYTAKVAGTEAGVKDPTATFSSCFGAPFLPRHPSVYAELLATYMREHKSNCWLVNTGWSGGNHGVGKRMSISITRRLLSAALNGELDRVSYKKVEGFNLEVPTECQGVDKNVLIPENTWADKNAFKEKRNQLVSLFVKNFDKYKSRVDAAVVNAGPTL